MEPGLQFSPFALIICTPLKHVPKLVTTLAAGLSHLPLGASCLTQENDVA